MQLVHLYDDDGLRWTSSFLSSLYTGVLSCPAISRTIFLLSLLLLLTRCLCHCSLIGARDRLVLALLAVL